MRRIVITMTHPNGAELDVTSRLRSIGVLTDELEDELTDLVYGDIEFELLDVDGAVEAFLEDAEPGDEYSVRIERETGRRRPKWERLFGGVLDLPWSLEYDRKDKTVAVQVFSYSKVLADTSAETIVRDFSMRTASTTASLATITMNDTTDLAPGDELTINDGTNSESQTILTVDSGTTATAAAVWSNTFSDGVATLETPYHRNKSLAFLIDAVFVAAGIPVYEIDEFQESSDAPIVTDMSDDGLGTGTAVGLLDQGGEIEVIIASDGTYTATSGTSGFTNESGTTTPPGDWTPYATTEPGALEDADTQDDGTRSFDHAGSEWYGLRDEVTINSPGADEHELRLTNSLGDVVAIVSHFGDLVSYVTKWTDYSPANDEVWITYDNHAPNGFGTGIQRVYVRDIGGATTTQIESSFGGAGCRVVESLGLVFLQDVGGTLNIYNAATHEVIEAKSAEPLLNLWTLRHFGDFLACQYAAGSTTRLRIWNALSYEQVGDVRVSNASVGGMFGTRWTSDIGVEHYVGVAGGTFFIVATYFAGVLAYADFDGLSCAAALRELAIVAGSFVATDEYRVGKFTARAFMSGADLEAAFVLPTPLGWKTVPFSDYYKRSAVVTGQDSDGEDIERIVGDTGDSQYRMEIDSQLIQTEGLAESVGQTYIGFLSKQRRVEEVTIAEPDERIRSLAIVELSDRLYVVVSAETDTTREEQDLRLLEVG